jgi:hypothetical protein
VCNFEPLELRGKNHREGNRSEGVQKAEMAVTLHCEVGMKLLAPLVRDSIEETSEENSSTDKSATARYKLLLEA